MMTENVLIDEQRWNAVVTRDRAQDGQFYTGVLTTGVYCRPSCPSRVPLRQNVRFFDTPEEAERAGLRPCLRCRPRSDADSDPVADRIRNVCEYIRAHRDEPLSLENLSRRIGLSRFHLQRSFKAIVGVSPRQYVEACRLDALKAELRSRRPVTEAIYSAGFGSSSRVYARSGTQLGMTPAEYRSGGKNLTISYVAVDSPLGRMMVAATDRGLCSVQFGSSDDSMLETLRREYPAASLTPMERPYPDAFGMWMDALSRHLAGEEPCRDLPVDVRATVFQLKVWSYLQTIPAGQVQSYAEVAAAVGQPTAARAVAQACAANPVAIVIPCHRVIRGDGSLSGYRWGIERKRALLEQEQAAYKDSRSSRA